MVLLRLSKYSTVLFHTEEQPFPRLRFSMSLYQNAFPGAGLSGREDITGFATWLMNASVQSPIVIEVLVLRSTPTSLFSYLRNNMQPWLDFH